jgi:two-component system, NarL family, nitrate/nitrite response regulator NarL
VTGQGTKVPWPLDPCAIASKLHFRLNGVVPASDLPVTVDVKQIGILIADAQVMFREALRSLLEREHDFRILGEAGNGREALQLANTLKPDVLLLDLSMPRVSGMEALRRLASLHSQTRPILFVESPEKSQVVEALKLGARGILPRRTTTQMLLKCIRAVASGEYWVGHQNISDLIECIRTTDPKTETRDSNGFRLTRRELEIVNSIVDGYTNREIAKRFSISEQTVKHHLTSIFEKVGVTNRLELALFAMHQRLASDA